MVTIMAVKRGDVVLVNLDPTIGKEIQKTRPCLVVSPNELNEHLRTFIVAPMTTGEHSYPFRTDAGSRAGTATFFVSMVMGLKKICPSTLPS